jgi:hypothetical protein
LVRAGSTFTGFYSSDGLNWTQIGTTQTVLLANNADAGLAVTANDNTQLATAVFANVSLTPNLALGGAVIASSSLQTPSWSTAALVSSTTASSSAVIGWSSDSDLNQNHDESVQIDLRSVKTVSEVTLFPRTDGIDTGYGFPVNFTIQISSDGRTWKTVITRSNCALPVKGTPQVFTFKSVKTRYVRVNATKLRSNPNELNHYRLQFASIEVD